MATVFTLPIPVTLGTLANPITIKALKITSVWFSTTPALAQIGAAELEITLTETANGWQETIVYNDATVVAFFSKVAPTPPAGATFQDVMAAAVFAKIIADGKLPAGTLSTTA